MKMLPPIAVTQTGDRDRKDFQPAQRLKTEPKCGSPTTGICEPLRNESKEELGAEVSLRDLTRNFQISLGA
jgi:hypothetical protein